MVTGIPVAARLLVLFFEGGPDSIYACSGHDTYDASALRQQRTRDVSLSAISAAIIYRLSDAQSQFSLRTEFSGGRSPNSAGLCSDINRVTQRVRGSGLVRNDEPTVVNLDNRASRGRGHAVVEFHDRRARCMVPRQPVCTIVAWQHARRWRHALLSLPAGNVILQPRNCRTAKGALLGLFAIDVAPKVRLSSTTRRRSDEARGSPP